MTVDDVLAAHNAMAPDDRRVTLRDLFNDGWDRELADVDVVIGRLRTWVWRENKCIHGAPFPSACLTCFRLGIDN